jgi:hypothetical protein
VIASRVLDFGFHRDGEQVRAFETRSAGVLRFSADVNVSVGRHGDVVLWHYAFAGTSSRST